MASPYLRTTPSVGAGPSEQVPRHGIARQSTTRPRDRHSHSVSPDPVADGKRRSRSPHTDDLSVGNRLRARHFTELRAVTRGVPRVGTVTKRPRAPLDQRREDSEIDTDAPTNEQVHGGSSSKLKRYKPTGKPPGLKSGSGARNSTAQVQQDAEYMADVDDFEEELINPTYATRMDLKDGTAGGDRSRRPVSLDQLIASVLESSSRDSIAQTLSPIIEYYQNIADRQQVPLAAATSTFRNSVANLTLHDVLTVFRGPFSDTLLSTLLAVEEPGNASACFAPVYTAEKWLNCSERSVPDRVANIFGDMCKALNAFTTETSKFPFSNVHVGLHWKYPIAHLVTKANGSN
ncbi:hypothetical protein HBI95_178850 [Parastagonospora nodorum]|nr:hypothetical protein HBI95_178850 [Parastagonospora nodorum]KAH4201484.1 hypothetical protein HBH42_030070 [Parastagonospora nodorum]KAH4897788.1 hypothetical protein HBH74_189420 [Parastagonospora nodorum]KAH4982954.1 hypothetical protein HBH73_032950 [Parastagonospora nodorum]KAH5513722.1 hypothetical protein HBI31_014620 [Parastagonospora nodorum]